MIAYQPVLRKRLFRRPSIPSALIFASAVLFLGHPVSAQCSFSAMGYQNISVEPNNPFQAEYTSTFTPPLATLTMQLPPRLQSVARDSQGRVRIESSLGKFDVQAADGTQTKEDRRAVSLCDPVTHTSIQLDSLNKTATVQTLPFLPPAALEQISAAKQPFCTRYFEVRSRLSSAPPEDLGQQPISGVPARGLRVWSPRPISAPDSTVPSNYTDIWCSDELGAIVDQVLVSGNGKHKRETLLQNISRTQPDPTLFEIPPGYTRIERERTAPAPRPGLLSVPPNQQQ